MLREYHKIETVFEREMTGKKKLIEGKFRNPCVEYLANNDWEFTEKVDGTNIRVYWDGHKVSFHGRTDKAQLPVQLANKLVELFGGQVNEELFEQQFGEKEVILFGEGYGAGIQGVGKTYSDTQTFILFDILIGETWLDREDVEKIGNTFGVKSVPVVLTGTIQEAVNYVKGNPKSTMGTCIMEGLVGRPKKELKDKCGYRLIVKIKGRDFDEN